MISNPKNNISLNQLSIGETGVIKELKDDEIALKLFEMGCMPGSKIEVIYKAAWGGPMCVKVCGYRLSLRRDEASSVILQNVSN